MPQRFTPLRIIIVNPSAGLEGEEQADPQIEARNRALRIALLEAGYQVIAVLPMDTLVTDHIRKLQPDMVIVDAHSGARDAVDSVVLASRDDPRPIVMFTDDEDPEAAKLAIAGGVTTYIVKGLQVERVRSILEVAAARFARDQALQAELAQARSALSERKTIDQAKRILMRLHGLSEDEAYARLRKTAMDQKMKMADLAQKLVDASALLG